MENIIQKFQELYPFPLDDFQIKACESLLNRESVLVTAPTGSGKTVIAEFTIFEALDRNLRVIYTTPLKALSNQKFKDLSEQYGASNVGLVTGDVALNSDAKIIVMTTEILRNILYQDIRRLDEVLYIILDECHYMNDRERGTVWEEIIIHAPKHLLFVALSATVSNANEVSNWITSIHNKTTLIEHPFRPVPLEHFYYSSSNLSKILNTDGTISSKILKKIDDDSHEKRNINPIILVKKLQERNLLPAIYFVFSRKGCDINLLDCLNSRLNLVTREEKQEIQEIVKKVEAENPMLAEASPITKKLLRALQEGIAVHHAGLVPVVRFLVENLFQRNLLKVIFATETLAAGINMPARTTIISSLSKRGDFGHEILSANSFKQMSGRAGRRGKDTIGYCVVVNDGKQPLSEAIRLVQSEPDPIKSNFTLSYNMVLNLLKNYNYKDINETLQKSFGQYLANKEIIDLKLNLDKKEEKIEKSFVPCKYKPELNINQMPLLAYEKIQDNINEQNSALRKIQKEYEDRLNQKMKDTLFSARKGSILIIKTENDFKLLACLISTYMDRNDKKFYVIVQSDKGVTRIRPIDCIYVYRDQKNVFLPDDIYADAYQLKLGAWLRDKRLGKLFNKNEQKRYMKNITVPNKYQDLMDEHHVEIYELKKQLNKHECSSCDILQEHLKEHREFIGIKDQIINIQKTIKEREDLYINNFNKMVDVLKHFSNLEKNSENQYVPNEYGLLTSYIRAENDLAISLVISQGLLDDLDSVECAAIISTLIFEPRRESYGDFDYLPRKIKNKLKQVNTIITEINSIHKNFGIDKEISLETDFIEIVLRWGHGESWKNLFYGNSLDDGDAIRGFRRVIDILHQLKNVPYIYEKTKKKFFEAIQLLDRDIISVNYEIETITETVSEDENQETELLSN
ncbi:MAG: DEAD/DEAH box helicase [Candidatus Sericytochromatia bacterium]